MKKYLLLIFLSLPLLVSAQNFVKSYSAYRCLNPATGYQTAAYMATAVYFYDDYIRTFTGEFAYYCTNADGSRSYVPTQQGSSLLSTQMITISADYLQMREIQQSSFGGMSMQIIYDYQCIGDGDAPAKNMLNSNSSMYNEGSGSSSYTCKSCGGTGLCEYCGGSGRPTYSGESFCGICRGTGKCQGCRGKGKY